MSTQNKKTALINEIIDKASGLSIEHQEWLLEIAKKVALTKICGEQTDS